MQVHELFVRSFDVRPRIEPFATYIVARPRIFPPNTQEFLKARIVVTAEIGKAPVGEERRKLAILVEERQEERPFERDLPCEASIELLTNPAGLEHRWREDDQEVLCGRDSLIDRPCDAVA